MKQIRRRTAILAAAALCWAIMFPEYVFTSDSYTAFVYEAQDPLYSEVADESAGVSAPDGAQAMESVQRAGEIQELYEAVREGRVRYRIGFIEYLRNYLFGT